MVGLGQRFGGDDAVGIHVLAKLRDAPPPAAELCVVEDPMALVDLLRGRELAIVVDAWLTDHPPGTIQVFSPDVVDANALVPSSSHGTSVGQALSLGKTLYPADFAAEVAIVAVAIQHVTAGADLSPRVRASVLEASARVWALLDAKPLRARSSS